MDINDFEKEFGFTPAEWESCLKVLSALKNSPHHNPDNQRFGTLISKIAKRAKKAVSEQKRAVTLDASKRSVLAQNALEGNTFYGNEWKEAEHSYTQVRQPKKCYICQAAYADVHSFYHRLCPSCAEINLKQRWRNVDLSGRNVVLTGGRVKVGRATALKLLRAGANLTLTTRFPALAFETFEKESDYESWRDRLAIYGLDLRIMTDVERFVRVYAEQHDGLDLLINNAAQTIQYHDAYYAPLLEKEQRLLSNPKVSQALLSQNLQWGFAKSLNSGSEVANTPVNRFGQPIDTRLKNSWNSHLHEIGLLELLEVNLINHISPFLLIKALTPLLKKSRFPDRFVINVTSSEGQFSYSNKTAFHPHTNMTKAALNMLTRTSGAAYAEFRVFMNAVDVGWISTGATEPLRQQQFEEGYIPPLDSVDGAARILQPVFDKLENKATFSGQLLKNYQVVDW